MTTLELPALGSSRMDIHIFAMTGLITMTSGHTSAMARSVEAWVSGCLATQ